MRWLAVPLVVAALAGCGDDGETEAPASTPAPATELTVTVEGEKRTVTDAAGITPKDLAPTPGDVACTEIYGGDATASIVGTIDGQSVDARFSLVNGCEIARWEDASALLGDPPQ
jgi:predicted small lipoprotein YifL